MRGQWADRLPEDDLELRYLGFDQAGSARAFRYEIRTKGIAAREATVVAEMALFREFRVGIQEGPTLCAAKLATDLEQSVDGTDTSHAITADDLRAHAQLRAAVEAKRIESRAAAGRRHHKTGAALENQGYGS